MPVQGHPPHSGLRGDVGNRSVGILPDRDDGRRQDLRPVALGVGPLIGDNGRLTVHSTPTVTDEAVHAAIGQAGYTIAASG